MNDPASLQLVFPGVTDWSAAALLHVIRDHPGAADMRVESTSGRGKPKLAEGQATPANVIGLLAWSNHVVRWLGFEAPMPYGPIESCVGPAMMPPQFKDAARAHAAHVVLYYAGTESDPLEQSVALAYAAGIFARLGAIVVLNEEARAAVPALDLVPDDGEDIFQTLRGLPIPYLYGGFVKMDVGDPNRPWVRTFANHRFQLPNLAGRLESHTETSRTFRLFSGILGYARGMTETLSAGDEIDLIDEGKLFLRAPSDQEWFLDSPGTMLVVEQA